MVPDAPIAKRAPYTHVKWPEDVVTVVQTDNSFGVGGAEEACLHIRSGFGEERDT